MSELIEQLAKDSPILSQYLNGDTAYEEMYLNALEAFAKTYQVAAPIDNGIAEALEKAAHIAEVAYESLNEPRNGWDLKDSVQAQYSGFQEAAKEIEMKIRKLIPTQANRTEGY